MRLNKLLQSHTINEAINSLLKEFHLLQGDSVPERKTFTECRGYTDDSESHRNAWSPQLRAMVQKSRGKKEQKHINRTESILFKNCTTACVQNYDRKSSGKPDSGSEWYSLHSG
ncbi:hypothetical protein TNCV_1197791 [Trichonephila clavipes]|uniref:Uncharacterized protein n=1 Tax=Trichonephila clavipes TaxID=2585209 RepID=A0A8X6S3Q7_TRICX|nr:hypothetical protein TNCV_1197791 [Trichonephila clavipes]